ncbi:tetratricopeptide repeat protein [Endozoicomonas euniceicola]|uniref:Tetratricopeptide repeat protein n=1 Tax=Endozoicomonas euniceicola TaxID=1234143 RepID=A0ABY6GP00_9GAMM|nr:tetratricopeptide repeat protein [Endozoicomonas euniceicola]UYM14474.1 tetratricopeptide repeat protein [Endozoicomonas euniceicola]
MKKLIFILLCFCASIACATTDFDWDGGDLHFQFSTSPYQQREPRITSEEYETLNKVVELVKNQRESDAMTELRIQLARKPSAAMWFSLAQLQQQQQQHKAAVESLRHSIDLLPQFTRAHESLGLLLTQQGNYKAARPHLRQAARQGAPAQIYAMLGYGYLQTSQPQAATAAYSHALMLAGDNPQWKRGLLHAAMAAGDDSLARSMTDQLLADAPDNARLYILRAGLAQRQNHWPEAIASLEIAQQLMPGNELSWQLAQVYLSQGYYQMAQPHLLQFIHNGIEGHQQQLLEMADYLISQQQYTLADNTLKTLMLSSSLNASERSHGFVSQAMLLAEKNPGKSASQQIDLLQKSLKLNPLNGRALIAMAGLYEDSNPLQAEALYRRAESVSSVQLEALQRHAQLLLTQEAYRRAEQLLQQAVKQSPNDRQLRDNLVLVSRIVQSQG